MNTEIQPCDKSPANMRLEPKPRPKHVGPNIFPNFPVFTRLVGYASRGEAIVIRDVTNGFTATHLQLLTDVLHLRNVLYDSLDENTRDRLWNGEEVFFHVLAAGGYEFATAFLAILAIGGVIVPLCKSHLFSDTMRS